MTELLALSIVTGILCGIWSQLAPMLGLITWAGFAGCTTYFASGKHGKDGFLSTIRQNLFGVLCGMTIIFLSNKLPISLAPLIYSGFITFIMCIAKKIKGLEFIPGTFVGCFSTFASNGDWKVLVPTLLIGASLGVACDLGGKLFYKLATKNKIENIVEKKNIQI
ncbi:MAG: DUF1097 domain-containing protein [Tissierellia bacterium]|nr:DUF1097 domain-containing protein [Tissierellia bacterium]